MTSSADQTLAPFTGEGEMAQRCRAIDWSSTALGPVEDWPRALATAVQMTLESPFPINLWCGPQLLLIYNDAYRAVLGAKHPAALGRPGSEVWSEIWADIGPMFETIRSGGPSVYADDARFSMERTDGEPTEAWFTFSLSPVRDDSGEIIAFLNIASETTERVLFRLELEEARADAELAERRLREIFVQAPAFLAVMRGRDYVFEFVNDAYLQLIGNRDILGKPVVEALPEVVDQGFIAILDRVLDTGEPFIGRETPVMLQRTPSGRMDRLYVDFVYQPLTDASGKRIGIVAHGSDVTKGVLARREMEFLLRESEKSREQLRQSAARYRFLANAIPVQVWTATADGALDYVSDRTAEYFGKTPAEVIGDQWLSVLNPDDVDRTLERWRHSLTTGEDYEVEFRLWSVEHQAYRWHLGRATAQRDEDGDIIAWFGTNTEIEDRKQQEAELKRLTAEATEANHAKSAFLAAMSHELRTPLNAIGGYAQLIEMGVRGPVTEEQKVDLLKIQRSKNHLDSLVADVLNFAKLGSGKIEYRVKNVDVDRMFQSVIEMVTPQLAEKELRLKPPDVASRLCVRADEDKMRQILLNLLANSLKFTPPGGTISLAANGSSQTVDVAVSDTGIGIPNDKLESIFEPFVQAKGALRSGDQGVGLGLAISRQLARAMGGDLKVASKVGEGSTFTLALPRVIAEPEPRRHELETGSAEVAK
ncbi:MAG TPA: PAS domain-containing protein [Gemmatimonadaceae bacterium]|nr:PAS domain-containing protein [Gemmatimonadaceae bacterium]